MRRPSPSYLCYREENEEDNKKPPRLAVSLSQEIIFLFGINVNGRLADCGVQDPA